MAACPGGEFPVGSAGGHADGRNGTHLRRGLRRVHLRSRRAGGAVQSALDWATLGAVPEMLQTAYGSLTVGLDAQPGQTLLVRGGTSSVGMATAVLAKRLGLTVLSTTRNLGKAEALQRDRRRPCRRRRRPDSRPSARHRARRCRRRPGTRRHPDPAGHPRGVPAARRGVLHRNAVQRVDGSATSTRSTTSRAAYGSPPTPAGPLICRRTSCRVSSMPSPPGRRSSPSHRVYQLDEIRQAHAEMEGGTATGKIVVLTPRAGPQGTDS